MAFLHTGLSGFCNLHADGQAKIAGWSLRKCALDIHLTPFPIKKIPCDTLAMNSFNIRLCFSQWNSSVRSAFFQKCGLTTLHLIFLWGPWSNQVPMSINSQFTAVLCDMQQSRFISWSFGGGLHFCILPVLSLPSETHFQDRQKFHIITALGHVCVRVCACCFKTFWLYKCWRRRSRLVYVLGKSLFNFF